MINQFFLFIIIYKLKNKIKVLILFFYLNFENFIKKEKTTW